MTIISAQTGSKTSDKVIITQSMLPVTVMATGLSPGEEIAVKFSDDLGANFETLSVNGGDIVLSSTNKVLGIYTPQVLQFVKGTTANAVRVTAIIREYTNGESN